MWTSGNRLADHYYLNNVACNIHTYAHIAVSVKKHTCIHFSLRKRRENFKQIGNYDESL